MASLAAQLLAAAQDGDVEGVQACLAAGADANDCGPASRTRTPLLRAARFGHARCAAALLEAGADPSAASAGGRTPLHNAALYGHVDCVAVLLAAGANPLARTPAFKWMPLHLAVMQRHSTAVPLLLAAAPAAALARGRNNRSVLDLALDRRSYESAHCLLTAPVLLPAEQMLAALSNQGPWAAPLYASLVSNLPLTDEQWARVQAPCDSLATALPAVLARSAEEASLLVRHLPAANQARLCTAAFCLARAQRQVGVELPTPLVWRVLALSAT